MVEDMCALQRLRYASNRHALLLVFQVMDAAGKDVAIRSIMSGLDPQGCTPDLVRSHAVPVDVKELTAFLTGAKVLPDDAFISKAKRCIYVRVSVEATAAALSKDQKIDVTGTTLASGEIRREGDPGRAQLARPSFIISIQPPRRTLNTHSRHRSQTERPIGP